jgi:hypothetical protein
MTDQLESTAANDVREARRLFPRPGTRRISTPLPSWLAAVGDEAALSTFELFGADAVFALNREFGGAARRSARRGRLETDRATRC